MSGGLVIVRDIILIGSKRWDGIKKTWPITPVMGRLKSFFLFID